MRGLRDFLVVGGSGRDDKEITGGDVVLLAADGVGGGSLQHEVDFVHGRMTVQVGFDRFREQADRYLRDVGENAATEENLFQVSVSSWFVGAIFEPDQHWAGLPLQFSMAAGPRACGGAIHGLL